MRFLLTFMLGSGLGISCAQKGKVGETCSTTSAESTDCEEGLTCADCGKEGYICVKRRADNRGMFTTQSGRNCKRVMGVNETSDIPRGGKRRGEW